MQKFIDAEHLESLLKEIRNQHIFISFRDLSGHWSPEFYSIEPVGEMTPAFNSNLLIVKLPITDTISIVDLRTITGLRLNKYLRVEDGLYSMFDIYNEQNLKYFKAPTESDIDVH